MLGDKIDNLMVTILLKNKPTKKHKVPAQLPVPGNLSKKPFSGEDAPGSAPPPTPSPEGRGLFFSIFRGLRPLIPPFLL